MKNNSIEFLRFLFMQVICLHHINWMINFFSETRSHGYLAVEFFFILSGFLIAKSYAVKPLSTIDWMRGRFIRLYPTYIVSFFIALILENGLLHFEIFSIDNIMRNVTNIISDLLLLQSTGIFGGTGVNPPTWYLSVFFWGGGLLYVLMKALNSRQLCIFLGILCMTVYTVIINNSAGCFEIWEVRNGIYIPYWRGIADMSVGVLVYKIFEATRHKMLNRIYYWINILGVLSIVVIISLLFTSIYLDIYMVLFSAILIFVCFTQNNIFSRIFSFRIWSRLGGITYEMLLLHYPIIVCLSYCVRVLGWNPSTFVLFIIYQICLLMSSIILHLIIEKIMSRCEVK